MESTAFSPFVLLVSVVALEFCREELWTSNLAEKCSVGLGLNPCLHSKLIPSSPLDCVLGYRGRTKGYDSGDRHWSFPTRLLGVSPLVKDLRLLALAFWVVYGHHFFVQVQLLATFTQISAFLNSLACCPFQVSRSQPCTLLSPTLFLPASSFPVYSLSHPTGAPGSLIPESMGTSSSHLRAFVPLSGMSFPSSGQLSSKLFIIEHPTLGQLWRFFHLWSEVAFESNPSRTFLEVWWLRDFTFQCRGRGFELWLGSWDPACHRAAREPSFHKTAEPTRCLRRSRVLQLRPDAAKSKYKNTKKRKQSSHIGSLVLRMFEYFICFFVFRLWAPWGQEFCPLTFLSFLVLITLTGIKKIYIYLCWIVRMNEESRKPRRTCLYRSRFCENMGMMTYP